ncbi:hypothetical protein [Paenibacillus sp. USDA918EY]|uniref:hypothetical protein n=1 Tax=Paenibacillus sp. USDA918EY TaxID=2689575 RepID=UPI001F2A2140|nr:hypothetical protein [Paenibacillus sp. USDA918EY]
MIGHETTNLFKIFHNRRNKGNIRHPPRIFLLSLFFFFALLFSVSQVPPIAAQEEIYGKQC